MSKRRPWELVSSTACLISPLLFLHLYIYIIPLIYSLALATHIHLIPHSQLSAYVQESTRKHIVSIMDTQNCTRDGSRDEMDNNRYDWIQERFVGKTRGRWPRFNSTNNTHSSNNAQYSDDFMQGDLMATIPSPSNTSLAPASTGKQATSNENSGQESTKGWRMATYTTAEGEPRQSWCTITPAVTVPANKITLAVHVDQTKQEYTITPCFPARNEAAAVFWEDPETVSHALTQIKAILSDIDPSVCFSVKTKDTDTSVRQRDGMWHVRALNDLQACSSTCVSISNRKFPVMFGLASTPTPIKPEIYHPTRDTIIDHPSGNNHHLRAYQRKSLLDQLPKNHPCYCLMESQLQLERES